MTNYNPDDNNMFNLYTEGMDRFHTRASTGQDQFTPKLSTRGNPNKRLSYASYFEEELVMPEIGTQMNYTETGDQVWIVDFDKKTMTATIELPDETKLYNIPVDQLTQ